MFADGDGGRVQILSVLRVHLVVQGRQHHVMAKQSAFPNGDAALVLELASGVKKHSLIHCNVFSKVGIEGRKQRKRLIHRLTDDL